MSSLLDRLGNKFLVGDGCWDWIAAKTGLGYGVFWLDGKNALAHRVVYEILVGPIPDGLEIDHLCKNRACVRPDHLEPVTSRVNTLRSGARSALNARKTACHRGHELAGDNLYVNPRGERQCKECRRAADQRHYRKMATREDTDEL